MLALIMPRIIRLAIGAAGVIAILIFQPAFASSGDADTGGGQQALGISSNFVKWPGGAITWVYNSTNAPAGYTDDVATAALFQAAIDEWAGYCDVSFTYAGVDDTADILDTTDNVVVFQWEIIGAAGVAGPFSTSATETTSGFWSSTDGTLRLNPSVFAFVGGTAAEQTRNRISFHSTAVHELGHLLGIGHSDRPDSVMYANPYNSITHVTDDDILACRSMYGYSDVHKPPARYAATTAGSNSYSLSLTLSGSMTPITTDDGSNADNAFLSVFWILDSGAAPETITQDVVDPDGYLATSHSTAVAGVGSGGWFSITDFGRIREMPGLWTYYLRDSTGLVGTLTIDVTTSLPVVNEAPTAEFSFSENPATRGASLTTNVTGDTESDMATIVWHLPGTGTVSVPLNAASGSDAKSLTFSGSTDWEVFAEVNDDAARYTADGANNIGPAGPGFQRLYRYASSGRNHTPDHDGDNSSDILWRNASSGQNWFYSMAGNLPKASIGVNTVSDTLWEIVGDGDQNADGKSDILWRNSSTGQNWLYLMNGAAITGSVGINTVSDVAWKIVGHADYDGDGNADILWRNSSTGQNWMYLMNGAAIVSSVGVNTVSDLNWSIVSSGDFNGDGNADILWRNGLTGQNWLYLMSGAAISSSVGVNTVADLAWVVAGSGDYNGDGNADILWRNGTTGQNWMYLMNGALISSSVGVNTVPLAWQIAGSGDYNGDGNADILWRNGTTGQNWMYQMNGAAITASVGVNTVSDVSWQIVDRN